MTVITNMNDREKPKMPRMSGAKNERERIPVDVFVRASVQALEAAAGRSRRVLIVIITISIVVFAAFWNSRQESWFNYRILRTQQALAAHAYEEKIDWNVQIRKYPNFPDLHAYCNTLGMFKDPSEADPERKLILESTLEHLKRLKRESIVLVRVPVVGTVFDVNDLGLMAGVTFSFLLLTYWFSLTRERDTLQHVFSEAERRDDIQIKDVYHLVSATQVLDVPSTETRQTGFTQKYMTKILAMPPLLLQSAILYNDQNTVAFGKVLSESQTSLSLMIGGVCLFSILVLTIACIRVGLDLTREWDNRFIALQRGTPEDVGHGSEFTRLSQTPAHYVRLLRDLRASRGQQREAIYTLFLADIASETLPAEYEPFVRTYIINHPTDDTLELIDEAISSASENGRNYLEALRLQVENNLAKAVAKVEGHDSARSQVEGPRVLTGDLISGSSPDVGDKTPKA